MKSVLLHIADDKGIEARLQASLDLTRSLDGRLHCLHANPYYPQMAFDGITGMSVMYDVSKMTQKADEKLRSQIEAQLADEDVPWDYHNANAESARAIAKNSTLTDIIVMSSAGGDKDSNQPMGLLGDVLFNTVAPVVVQPDNVRKFDASGPALVAWNGSFEAGNALRAAVPLLKMASDTHILTVEEDKDHDLPPLAASEYLSRYGVKSKIHAPEVSEESVETVLRSTAGILQASYIVMGAYGHSRAREFLFGGVTRSLFRDCPIPLVVSH